MSHAAQCLMCAHARRHGRLPIACARFADPDETQSALNHILYRLAGTGHCAERARFPTQPDAYFAEDAPDARSIGEVISDMLKRGNP